MCPEQPESWENFWEDCPGALAGGTHHPRLGPCEQGSARSLATPQQARLYIPHASHPANISDLQTRQLWLREERPPCSEAQGPGVPEASWVLTPEPGSFSEWQKQYRLLAIQRPLITGGKFWPGPCCCSEFTTPGRNQCFCVRTPPEWGIPVFQG